MKAGSTKAALYFNPGLHDRGGGYVQTLRTAAALRSLGHAVNVIHVNGAIGVDSVDAGAEVHQFVGINPRFIPLMRRIRAEGRGTIALSTIYWWTPRMQKVLTPDPLRYARYALARYVKRVLKRHLPRYELFRLADVLLPNSPGEAELVRRNFPVAGRTLVCPVPNAADPLPPVPPQCPVPSFLPDEYVLCAGAFNPRKNQLGLIRAMKDSKLPLVLMGAAGCDERRYYGDYYRACRAEGEKRALFLDHAEHRSPLWHAVFSRARVFAMPSACETPCLAALEAAMFGSAIALTEVGSAGEYFGPHAVYCDPTDPAGIRAAVEKAWAGGKGDETARHVAARFTWNRAAEATLGAYALARSRSEKDRGEYEESVRGLWFGAEAGISASTRAERNA